MRMLLYAFSSLVATVIVVWLFTLYALCKSGFEK